MKRGFITIARGIFEHPSFPPEPFTEREAWMWLIEQAAWKDTTIRIGRAVIELKRGQCAFSLRFLASKWKWSLKKVRCFLERHTKGTLVATLATRDATLITVCKYEKYQGLGHTEGHAEGHTEGSQQGTKKNNEPITNKQRTDSQAVATATRPDLGKIFDDHFWPTYPKREGSNPKAPARTAFAVAVKSGADPSAIVAAAGRYAASIAKSNQTGTRFVAQAKTWLHQKRWQDYPEEAAQAAGPPRPPDPTMPSHEELKRRYGVGNEQASGQGVGVRTTGDRICRETTTTTEEDTPDDQTRDAGMAGMGTLFPELPRVHARSDAARVFGKDDGDDSPEPMAGVVRH